jgi:hypothetical protein
VTSVPGAAPEDALSEARARISAFVEHEERQDPRDPLKLAWKAEEIAPLLAALVVARDEAEKEAAEMTEQAFKLQNEAEEAVIARDTAEREAAHWKGIATAPSDARVAAAEQALKRLGPEAQEAIRAAEASREEAVAALTQANHAMDAALRALNRHDVDVPETKRLLGEALARVTGQPLSEPERESAQASALEALREGKLHETPSQRGQVTGQGQATEAGET